MVPVPRVLLVWPFFPPEWGAASLRGAAYARVLREEGVDVRVLAPDKALAPDGQAPAPPDGIPVTRAPLFFDPGDLLRWFAGRAAIRETVADHDPDLVVASTPPPMVGWQALGPIRDAEVPLAVDVRDLFTLYMRVSHGDKLRYALSDRMEARLYRAADRLLVVTDLMADQLRERYGIPKDRTVTVRNGADTDLYADLPDVDPDHDVLFLGAFQRGRRGRDLLEAYRRVAKDRPGTSFLFLGTREQGYVDELSDLIEEPPLAEAVAFADPVPPAELPATLARCRIGVLALPDHPAYRANVARKVYDYLAAGLPVVVVGPDGPAELRSLLEETGAGIYTSTVEGFAEAVAALLEDEDRRLQAAERARRLGERCDLDGNIREAWRDVLAPLVEGR